MNIVSQKNGSALTVAVQGRLDTLTAPAMDAFLAQNLDGVTELNFDLAELEYISSAGLRTLLCAQKKMNTQGKMTVTNPGEAVMEVLELTGFTEILTIL